ncbi:MAG: MraY family glycosyltransferase [bacterium]|nr:MraY family glycosyltransferase [bacterium]
MPPDEEATQSPGYNYGFFYLYGVAFFLLLFVMMPQVRGWLKLNDFRWVYIPAVSMLVTFLMTPLVRAIAHRIGALDVPDARKVHQGPTALLGGLAVFIGFGLSVGVNNLYSPQMKGVGIAALLILIIGLMDDIRKVPATIKLLGQIAACTIVVYSGVRLSFLPAGWLGDSIEVVLTFVGIIGIANALNFLDGMDGLAAGLGAISSFFIGLVALQTNQPFLMFLSLGLMGGCIGFLPYNFRPSQPASIFLGDAGSTFIGFTLACLAVMGEWDTQDPIKAFLMPLLILGVTFFDMSYITLLRFGSGRVRNIREWLEYVGRDHIHHKLNDLGLSRHQTVFFIFLLSISLGISSIVMKNGRTVDAFLLLIQGFNMFFMLAILMQKGSDHKENGKDD